jgi:threonine dehydrogenase-like Zn-dependent dehydrogenase
VALAASGRLHGAALVTHHLPLADITEGFRRLRERIGDPLKMVFVP